MFGQDFSGKKLKAVVWISTAVYLILACLYFLPAEIPYKISFPLASAAIFSIFVAPWPISVALFASTAGDFMGATGNFMGQMECFAVAHLFLTLFFLQRLFQTGKASAKNLAAILTKRRVAYIVVTGFCVTVLLLMSMVCIVPEVPAGTVRAGVAFYTLVISLMLFSALMQRSIFYAVGAVLFVMSDFILAWNRFVEPVEYEKYMIMVPYYLAQWMLYVRSTKYRIGKSLLLTRL